MNYIATYEVIKLCNPNLELDNYDVLYPEKMLDLNERNFKTLHRYIVSHEHYPINQVISNIMYILEFIVEDMYPEVVYSDPRYLEYKNMYNNITISQEEAIASADLWNYLLYKREIMDIVKLEYDKISDWTYIQSGYDRSDKDIINDAINLGADIDKINQLNFKKLREIIKNSVTYTKIKLYSKVITRAYGIVGDALASLVRKCDTSCNKWIILVRLNNIPIGITMVYYNESLENCIVSTIQFSEHAKHALKGHTPGSRFFVAEHTSRFAGHILASYLLDSKYIPKLNTTLDIAIIDLAKQYGVDYIYRESFDEHADILKKYYDYNDLDYEYPLPCDIIPTGHTTTYKIVN